MIDQNINSDAIRFFGSKTVEELFSNLLFCKIVKVETATENSTDYNGYVTVQNLFGGEVIRNVLLPMTMAGNSQFVGGLPLENTLCLVGTYTTRNIPVVVAYIPFRFDVFILPDKRGNVTDENGVTRENIEQLYPGEYLVQAAKAVVNLAQKKLQIPLGRIKLDNDGRIIIRSQNQIVTITIGDTLGSGTALINSKTNKHVVYRINCKKSDETAGITLDIDVDGNYVIENVNGDYIKMTTDTIEFDSEAIKLGANAQQAIVLGTLFKTFYNLHYHSAPSGITGPPVNQMTNTYLSTKGKVE